MLCFLCKSPRDLPLAFRSLIHFALILYFELGRDPTSIFTSGYLVVPTPIVEKTIISPTELSWQ